MVVVSSCRGVGLSAITSATLITSYYSRISHGAVNTFPALYTPPVKPWEPGYLKSVPGRPRVKPVTGAKS